MTLGKADGSAALSGERADLPWFSLSHEYKVVSISCRRGKAGPSLFFVPTPDTLQTWLPSGFATHAEPERHQPLPLLNNLRWHEVRAS